MDSKKVIKDRIKRMQWWHDARFGMFVHWGLYAQHGRNEWVMNRERIPVEEYEKLAATWKPKERPAREWAALAKKAGMKYMVMTTKHHEGFCLWDSKVTDYCATQHGPGRDLVKEYVEACREFGLKIGFYYSLMDWHHPDGHACARDEKARKRFTAYTQALVKELMSNYGKIDILWYDVSWPLSSPKQWESEKMNAMVRKLQPPILINDRSQLPEDFGTPEEHIVAGSDAGGRGWEACMTFNRSWGWVDSPDEDWHSARQVLAMLGQCASLGGNLLLNIGPKPDGSVPRQAAERLTRVGDWLERYGEAVYGDTERVTSMECMPITEPTRHWTRKGTTLYLWVARWPGKEISLGGLRGNVQKVDVVDGPGDLPFEQQPDRLIIRGLPATCPDTTVGITPLRIEFDRIPSQFLGCGCEMIPETDAIVERDDASPFIREWKLSHPVKAPKSIGQVKHVGIDKKLQWVRTVSDSQGFVNVHRHYTDVGGLVYLGTKVKVSKKGTWEVCLGHDGAAKLFVDGKSVAKAEKLVNPCPIDRTCATVTLDKGEHEIVVALDLMDGYGWGIYLRFADPEGKGKTFPKPAKKL